MNAGKCSFKGGRLACDIEGERYCPRPSSFLALPRSIFDFLLVLVLISIYKRESHTKFYLRILTVISHHTRTLLKTATSWLMTKWRRKLRNVSRKSTHQIRMIGLSHYQHPLTRFLVEYNANSPPSDPPYSVHRQILCHLP